MAQKKGSKAVKAVKKTARIVSGVIAAALLIVAAVCIGFAISWFASGTNTTAAIVCLIIGALALFIAVKLIQKIRNGIRLEREKASQNASGRSSGGYASSQPCEPKANRSLGSESDLKRAVQNALPSSGSYLGSWGNGDAYLRSISVDIWVLPRRVKINGNIEYKITAVESYTSESSIKNAAQDHLNDTASDFAERASRAVEDYMDRYSGFDGEWSISAGGLSATFSK